MKKSIYLLLLSFSVAVTNAQAIIIKPYVQDLDTASVVLMWEIDNADSAFLDWGLSPFNLFSSTSSVSQVGTGPTRIHTASVTNLSANTKYYYKVRTQSGIISQLYHFKTMQSISSEDDICLVAMSDMQFDGSYPNVFEDIIEKGIIPVIDTAGSGDLSELIDGILIPGDLVPTGGNYSHWKDLFFAKADSLLPYVPSYPVLGNHEYFGNGKDIFLKYFNLPDNGTPANLEEWWYKDISNVRIVGLNTNSNGIDQDTQLVWLQSVLDAACLNNHIDFVFCQFHHPHKSELWTPGESQFSGEIIEKLENFSSICGKPSIHLFGHTHGYSRGQSMDHQHLWVNVATAGGNIDSWGEFPNADYEEFVKSQDEYGFISIKVKAGIDPQFDLLRYSRGDEFNLLNNVVRDSITIKRYDTKPIQPITLYPFQDTINPACFHLVGNQFVDAGADSLQAAQWQISSDSMDFVNALVYESWRQNENWYNEVNTQASDDLTNEDLSINLSPFTEYYWRVRYRDSKLNWSEWSSFSTFWTDQNSTVLSPNLVLNGGAELGIQSWAGQIEDLTSNQCGSVPVYLGTKMFAVGGICQNESSHGRADQNISVLSYEMDILQADVYARFGAFMRNFSGSDRPSVKLEFLDNQGMVVSTSDTISNLQPQWIGRSRLALVPPNTKSINMVLEGFRNAGTDNDSYFDELTLILEKGGGCSYYNPCPITRTVSNLIYDKNVLITAQDTIQSSSTILGSSNIEYRSSQEISLEPGFHIQNSSELKIDLDNCH